MIVNPPLDEAYLEHFGVKGMKWGRRQSKPDTRTPAERRKSRMKIAAGVVGVAAGTAAVAYLMRNRGKVRVSNVIGHQGGLASPTTARGQGFAKNNISQKEWRKRVSDLLGDIREGNADQDRWMRRQGLGRELEAAKLKDITRKLKDPSHVWEL